MNEILLKFNAISNEISRSNYLIKLLFNIFLDLLKYKAYFLIFKIINETKLFLLIFFTEF